MVTPPGQDKSASTFACINTETLLENYEKFAAGGRAIAPVVKANAYGHGAAAVSRVLVEETDAPFLIVASYRGVMKLREAGIAAPLLVIGHVPATTVAQNSYADVTFTAVGLEHLAALSKQLQTPQPIHLKIDTGMHRYGINLSNLGPATELISDSEHLRLTGVFSHLADDFDELNDFTKGQITHFNQAAGQLTERFPTCQTTHLASTASHDFRGEIEANTERIGIGLYGLANFTDEFETRPVLSLYSHIAALRTLPAGESVGYSRAYTTDRERVIATLPAGYFEGVDRRLSNQGVVRVGETLCPIVGNVSMNATTIDVTDCEPLPEAGDLVQLISDDPADPHAAGNIAQKISAANYRITMQLPARLPRVMVAKS